jgi:hypothetical protein
MKFKAFTSKIKLAYPAISAYEFEHLKTEKVVQDYIQNAMIYVLAQRPVLSFEKIEMVQFEDCMGISFEIHKQGSESILKCNLPFLQPEIESDPEKSIFIEVGSNTLKSIEIADVYNAIHGIKILNHEEEFILWLSPDKFIYEIMNGYLKGKLDGDIDEFISFMVHYVGKATDQNIWDRLTGHYTLRQILTLQKPMVDGSLPAHEITLLLLKIDDLLSVSILGDDFSYEDRDLPSEKTVSLDLEKMLIKLLNPEFNHPSKRFPNYPKSKDGLHQFEYNNYSYQILDAVKLKYETSEICGNLNENLADLILIKDNESVEIIKRI